jgi:hypothetical protein
MSMTAGFLLATIITLGAAEPPGPVLPVIAWADHWRV